MKADKCRARFLKIMGNITDLKCEMEYMNNFGMQDCGRMIDGNDFETQDGSCAPAGNVFEGGRGQLENDFCAVGKDGENGSLDVNAAYNTAEAEGVYIHVPFCLSKCVYCDFASYAGCGEEEQRRYFEALQREAALLSRLRGWTAGGGVDGSGQSAAPAPFYPESADAADCASLPLRADRPLHGRTALPAAALPDTIFIGGGTPSSVDAAYIAAVLDELPHSADAEITIECNPAAILDSRLAVYRAAGINRLSMGVQSFDDNELRFLGRAHTAAEAVRSFKKAREAGFDNINIDLIFGFPDQTFESWTKTLDTVLELSPEHISFYSLQIEEGTPLYEKFRRDEVEQIPDELNREMYREAVRRLKEAGYEHYEISNAAKPGFRCRHNLKYWSMAPYTGIGAAAHSFDGRRRFYQPDDLLEYEAAVEAKYRAGSITENMYIEESSLRERMTDYIFTGLRLIEGLDLELFQKMFGADLLEMQRDNIQRFIKQGLVCAEGKKLRFTQAGLDISNYIIGELIDW